MIFKNFLQIIKKDGKTTTQDVSGIGANISFVKEL